MLKNLSENLNILMSKNRLSANELARLINIPATTIKRIRNNEQANPTLLTLMPIAQYFSISLNQLIGSESLISFNKSNHNINKIPLLTWKECIYHDLLDYTKIKKHIFTERYTSPKSFALLIEDDDLNFFSRGSIIIIEPEKKPETGDWVIVTNIDNNIASLRKYVIDIDHIYLKPLVSGLDISIMTSKFKILGVIIQYKIDLKL